MQKIIKHFGEENQTWKFIEECGECISAIFHYRGGKIPERKLQEEIADVYNTVLQMMEIHGRSEIIEIASKKIIELEKRIDRENKNN